MASVPTGTIYSIATAFATAKTVTGISNATRCGGLSCLDRHRP